MPNIAVLAPMPRARVTSAVTVNPRWPASRRTAERMS